MRSIVSVLAGLVTCIAPSPSLAQEKKDDPASKIRLAADRTKSMNNLKQMAIGFHNHLDQAGAFPSDIKDKNGKALLSWRVAILPYVDEANLYKQFKLDEAWDSDNNKKLLEKLPKVYTAPRGTFEKGHTPYQSFAGMGAIMPGKPLRFNQVTDGLSNTFMIAEAGEGVPWTKPADIAFDPQKPLPKMGGIFDGNFNVAFADGSVRHVLKGAKEENLKKYITVAGGEVPGPKDLEP